MGTRSVPFSRELFIEREDFLEDPPRKFFRLSPGQAVRLRYAYIIRCTGVVKDPRSGEIVEVHCTYDPDSLGPGRAEGPRVKGTLHWVSAAEGVTATVRLYEHLFTREVPGADDVPDADEGPDEGAPAGPAAASAAGDWRAHLHPDSVRVLTGCKVEPALGAAEPGSRWQFERQGYFCADVRDGAPGAPVFNRTVTLRDTWARIQKKEGLG